jgi:SAM-dependent methyltransferase
MLKIAITKVKPGKVNFIQADINDEWNFIKTKYDLVCFSLVLEHIENLDEVFRKASDSLVTGGYVYIGELHPYKQYTGTKARFENDEGLNIVTCFNHNISDFTLSAEKNGFSIFSFNEYFDNDSRTNIPRILTIVFQKK